MEDFGLTPTDRIRRAAYAVARAVGSHDHARYIDICAVVLYADASVNDLEEWGYVLDEEAKAAAIEGAADIADRLVPRKRAA